MCVLSVDDSPLIVLPLPLLLLFNTFVIRTKNLVSSKVEFLRLLNRKRIYYDEQEYSIVIRMYVVACAYVCVCVCRACYWCSVCIKVAKSAHFQLSNEPTNFARTHSSLSFSLLLCSMSNCSCPLEKTQCFCQEFDNSIANYRMFRKRLIRI